MDPGPFFLSHVTPFLGLLRVCLHSAWLCPGPGAAPRFGRSTPRREKALGQNQEVGFLLLFCWLFCFVLFK